MRYGAAHLSQNLEASKLKQSITMFILALEPKAR